ncbi:hypothetical protein M9Y10_009213 [Tritrichomonas musculus]|uniref:Uncharacterized protein n=1 Tax=Tritrichomonas musculus TaxID=1915356 RepID=A0ABR2IMY0_9EUKA
MKAKKEKSLPISSTRFTRTHNRDFCQTSYQRFNDVPKILTNNINGTPGPGFYNIPTSSFDKNNHSHSIQSRTKIDQPSDAATLSFYDVNYKSVLPQRMPTSIGKSKREDIFGYGCSKSSNIISKTPGPSMPQPETLPSNPIKIGVKPKQFDKENISPGPASYNPQSSEPTKNVFSMKNSHSKREVSIFTPTSDVPGPGSYDPTPPLQRPKRWASRLKNIKPIPVIQLKRTIKLREQKRLNQMQYLDSTY